MSSVGNVYTWTLAQCQLSPDPTDPTVGARIGIQSVTMPLPGLCAWDIEFSPSLVGDSLASPDYIPLLALFGDLSVPAYARISTPVFPPMGPVTTVRVVVTEADMVTIRPLPSPTFVIFRLDRRAP